MDLLIAFIASILRAECYAWMPRLTEWLIERQISRLVPELQDRCREEWKASLSDMPNSVARFVHALSFTLAGTVSKMNEEFVEAYVNEFDRALKPLASQHCDNATKIRDMQRAIRQQLANIRELDECVVNSALDLKLSIDNLSDNTQSLERLALREKLLDWVGAFEAFGHNLSHAFLHVNTKLKAALDGFDQKADQTGKLLDSIYAKRAHLDDLRHKRETSHATLVLCREDLNQELKRLTLSIQDALADDGNTARDEEIKRVMTTITTVISKHSSSRTRAGSPLGLRL